MLEYNFSEPMVEKVGEEWRIEIEGCEMHEYNGLMIPAKPVYILLPPGTEVDRIEVKGKEKFLGIYNIQKAKPIIAGGRLLKIFSGKEVNIPYEKVGVYKARGYSILVMNLPLSLLFYLSTTTSGPTFPMKMISHCSVTLPIVQHILLKKTLKRQSVLQDRRCC